MIKIGLIGLDTSHATAFTALLNDPTNPNHREGGKVVAGWPGGSPDFANSANRVEGFTNELREKYQVEMMDSPEAVAKAVDLIFITAVDGRVHPELLSKVAPFGKPVFIDKPFALTADGAKEMIDRAAKEGIPLMSCSSLRYSEFLLEAMKEGREGILAADFYGPMNEVETQPGLFWYGCHAVEMMVTVMGTGCREVSCHKSESNDVLTAIYEDGRMATLHGLRGSHSKFGAVLHRASGPVTIDASGGRPFYLGTIDAIMDNLPNGQSPIPAEEMLEVVAIIEAGNASREANGKVVSVKR